MIIYLIYLYFLIVLDLYFLWIGSPLRKLTRSVQQYQLMYYRTSEAKFESVYIQVLGGFSVLVDKLVLTVGFLLPF